MSEEMGVAYQWRGDVRAMVLNVILEIAFLRSSRRERYV